MKSQYSLLNFFNWHFLHANERLLKQLNYVNYGARVRGSVFRTLFFILAKEFQSIEISAEFACLLEVIYLANESSFFPAKWEYLEMTFAISRKNLQVSMNYLIRLKVNKKLKTYSSPPWMGLKSWFIPRLWPTSWAITPPPNAWTPKPLPRWLRDDFLKIVFLKYSQSGLLMNLINTAMSRVSCQNDENSENQADQFRGFFHKMVLRILIIWTTNPWHGGV